MNQKQHILSSGRVSKRLRRSMAVCLLLTGLVACANKSVKPDAVEGFSPDVNAVVLDLANASSEQLQFPEAWERLSQVDVVSSGSSAGLWWQRFDDPQLDNLVDQALQSNFLLKSQAALSEQARQGVIVARANRLPSLTSVLSGNRRKDQSSSNVSAYSTSYSLGIEGQYEVDVWRSLSDAQRQSQLLYRTQQFEYEASRLNLIADVSRAWYTAVYATQLTELFSQRVDNIKQNLDIIERGYKQGINSALDVYLARTSAEQEQARLAQQEQLVLEQSANLQLLLAWYPSGQLELSATLPSFADRVPAGLPSEALTRRPDIQAAWSQLLAQDAAVAVAQKQRFPRLKLTASLGDGASALSDVIDGNNLVWSALGSLTQPLFQAGRLQAQEEQARQRLIQTEQVYLAQVQQAFAQVENALSNYDSLQRRFAAIARAEENASAAYDLSFQQYQRGLVDYTTVLQAEQRAFDANFNLIDLRYQLLINRINLYAALGGGEFS